MDVFGRSTGADLGIWKGDWTTRVHNLLNVIYASRATTSPSNIILRIIARLNYSTQYPVVGVLYMIIYKCFVLPCFAVSEQCYARSINNVTYF